MARLSTRRLRAIEEALHARLAGEIDTEKESGITREDYEQARLWATHKLQSREDR